MMKFYRVLYSELARKALEKMDAQSARRIVRWIGKNLNGSDEPRRMGKALSGNLSQYWRYRVGDYRILVLIVDDVLEIQVIKIGHRRSIYKQK